jgi:hypothetical protein
MLYGYTSDWRLSTMDETTNEVKEFEVQIFWRVLITYGEKYNKVIDAYKYR